MIIPKLTDKTLYDVCDEVPVGENLKPLIMAMDTVCSGAGVGLAANQIGSKQRVILINTGHMYQFIVNPVIVKLYGGKKTCREGCLSFPGKVVSVVRWKQCIVEGYTENWEPIRRKLKGINAQVVQHEVDHLDGITCMDKGKPLN